MIGSSCVDELIKYLQTLYERLCSNGLDPIIVDIETISKVLDVDSTTAMLVKYYARFYNKRCG